MTLAHCLPALAPAPRHLRPQGRLHGAPGRLLPLLLCQAAAGAAAAPLVVKVTDAAGQPLADAAVAVHLAGAAPASTAGKQAEIAQRGRAFVPPVLVVQAGTTVSFPNQDKVRHHVYSFSPAKTFEIKLYGGETPPAVVFDQPGTVVLGCNIHDRMVGYVHVVDTPHFTRTDAQGLARLDLPAGEHRVRVWHPVLTANRPAQDRSVRLGAAGADLAVKLAAEPAGTR